MGLCFTCETLIGMPSSVAPHALLEPVEFEDGTGAPRTSASRYRQYRCALCGSQARQNTLDGSPAGLWSGATSETAIEDSGSLLAHSRERRHR
jgi:hypothetical protein